MQPIILKTKYAFHLLLAFLKPDVVLDVGSMDGADSKRFAKLVPGASIVAFEGNPYNYRAMIADDDLKHIPVVAVTAFAMKGDEEKIREGGCEAYVAKPISVNDFLATIRKFLD